MALYRHNPCERGSKKLVLLSFCYRFGGRKTDLEKYMNPIKLRIGKLYSLLKKVFTFVDSACGRVLNCIAIRYAYLR